MMGWRKIRGILLVAALAAAGAAGGCAAPAPRPEHYAVPAGGAGPVNCFRVHDGLYRSGQPTAEEFRALARAGTIRSVLNLRSSHSDREAVAGTGLVLYELPLRSGSVGRDDLAAALRVIREAPRPLLVHCRHGSDRTGAVIAAWRIVGEEWTPDAAAREMVEGGYGHHGFWFPNLERLIRHSDWAALRAEWAAPPARSQAR